MKRGSERERGREKGGRERKIDKQRGSKVWKKERDRDERLSVLFSFYFIPQRCITHIHDHTMIKKTGRGQERGEKGERKKE